MVLPGRWFEPAIANQLTALDYKHAVLSPADALAIIEKDKGEQIHVADIEPTSIQGRFIYEVVLDTGEVRLIDANSGETIWITDEIAAEIARDYIQEDLDIKELELLESHDILYPFGPIPVYRVIFTDDQTNFYYVSASNGELSRSTSLTRTRAIITSLHTFDPINIIPNMDRFRKGLLVITSFIGLLTTILGYWIFLLPYLQRREQRNKKRPVYSE